MKCTLIAFITNRSFIDSRTFDGFRKCVEQDFSFAYIIDTKSDVRDNPKISGTKNNVFGIQTGVAVMFLIKQSKAAGEKCQIRYVSMPDEWTRKEKLTWFKEHPLKDIGFDLVTPDEKGNWLNVNSNDWESLPATASVQLKFGRELHGGNAIFRVINLGVSTNRDSWAYDSDKYNLNNKVSYFLKEYNGNLGNSLSIDKLEIKLSEALKLNLLKGKRISYDENKIIKSLYRPFHKIHFFADINFNDALTLGHYELFDKTLTGENKIIVFTGPNSGKPFLTTASTIIFDLHLVGAGAASQCLPLYRYDANGNRLDNITDWGLQQFQTHYQDSSISKEAIFYYTYAVLHYPAYRTKYELNLKRDFPRLPFYSDFWQWVTGGKALMELHINYESVTPFALERQDAKAKVKAELIPLFALTTGKGQLTQTETLLGTKPPKARLKADKLNGQIEIDEVTTLIGIPAVAWEYKLGNRSALEWVLDQYKEKKPTDSTIAAKFNTYRFADYKEHVIYLLQRVCTVSVETMAIIGQMPGE